MPTVKLTRLTDASVEPHLPIGFGPELQRVQGGGDGGPGFGGWSNLWQGNKSVLLRVEGNKLLSFTRGTNSAGNQQESA
jgi:hypothetical protein